MNVIVLCSEHKIPALTKILQRVMPENTVTGFSQEAQAVSFLGQIPADVAFVETDAPGMEGLGVAERLRRQFPMCNVVLIADDARFALEAFDLRCSGYLVRPILPDALRREMENLRFPLSEKPQQRIRIQTFGNFEVFVDGKPVRFGRSKSKELLAYLVDRKGAAVSVREAASILWEDEDLDASNIKQMQTIISEMLRSLRQVQADGIIVRNRNALSVDATRFACDYYQMLNGDMHAINAYTGEYLTNYSWAECTTGYLNSRE